MYYDPKKKKNPIDSDLFERNFSILENCFVIIKEAVINDLFLSKIIF